MAASQEWRGVAARQAISKISKALALIPLWTTRPWKLARAYREPLNASVGGFAQRTAPDPASEPLRLLKTGILVRLAISQSAAHPKPTMLTTLPVGVGRLASTMHPPKSNRVLPLASSVYQTTRNEAAMLTEVNVDHQTDRGNSSAWSPARSA
jgi:hypothetical protein